MGTSGSLGQAQRMPHPSRVTATVRPYWVTGVQPVTFQQPAWVRRALGIDPTGARLPASDRTNGR